jgi:crossover junction endodeoxyribonuclease RusA
VTGLRIIAHGAPATQGSKKAFIRGKKVVLVEMDERLPVWRGAVEAAARLAAGPDWKTIDGPVSIAGEVRLRRPDSTKFGDMPAGPPDLDKLQRAIGDALTKSKVIQDDARIVHWDIRKVWAATVPGIDITITQETP